MDIERQASTKLLTIKEKLSKILNSLTHIIEGVLIYNTNLSKFQNLLLDKSNGRIREKALKHKDF